MSRFFVGQRVRKVRGACGVGITGTVEEIGYKNFTRPVVTMKVKLDCASDGFLTRFEAGDCPCTNPDEWEPLLDQKHEACEDDFKRDLDRMLDKEEVL